MEISLPFRRDTAASAKNDSASSMNQHDTFFGEYIGIAVKSGLTRSVLGNSDRMKPLAEGSSFRVFRSSLREYHNDGTKTSVPVVVKMLRGSPYGMDPILYAHKEQFRAKQLEALVREMRVLCHSTLRNHENIPHILEWGFSTLGRTMDDPEDPKWQVVQPFIVLEYAGMRTLREFQHRHISNILRNLALDVASGLEALHSCSIVHGDVKLENILVFPHPQRGFCAKLSDFSHSVTDMSESNYLGTERYRPPELSGLKDSTLLLHDALVRCDILNFGVAMFEFVSNTPLEMSELGADRSLEDITSYPAIQDALTNLRGSEKNAVKEILQCSLTADPAKRKSMRQIRIILDEDERCGDFPGGSPIHYGMPTMLEVGSLFRQTN